MLSIQSPLKLWEGDRGLATGGCERAWSSLTLFVRGGNSTSQSRGGGWQEGELVTAIKRRDVGQSLGPLLSLC